MRYLRNTQIMRSLYKNDKHRYKVYKHYKAATEYPNLEIEYVRRELTSELGLDPTFEWYRNDEIFGQCVDISGDEYSYGWRIPVRTYKQGGEE
ncbi:hypothetical protein [Bacillus sp. RIT 809]|uniref:hypothetical protein n=1 Tax=Bacillus sp. RIT 809 TaxID=2803857 RepID=UPI00194EF215|nr:hypothetical protein [Bacillus sp. RIT 809]MBM6649047.1 hypothetical protein [Bacillus sp. RIT 809]